MNIFLKKMIESKMKDVPKEQRDQILGMIENNPKFFEKIVHDVQEKVKGGMSQTDAMMRVMKENETELKGML